MEMVNEYAKTLQKHGFTLDSIKDANNILAIDQNNIKKSIFHCKFPENRFNSLLGSVQNRFEVLKAAGFAKEAVRDYFYERYDDSDHNGFVEFYLIEDYYENGNLFSYVKEHGAYVGNSLIIFAKDLISIISDLHSKHVAHGNITPSNIMLDVGMGPVLIDYGIRNIFNEFIEDNTNSIQFRAPEGYFKKVIEPLPADIFSLGVVLFFMAVGNVPWQFDDEESIFKSQSFGKLVMPTDIDPKFANLIKKMLDRNPETRPSIIQINKYNLFKPSVGISQSDNKSLNFSLPNHSLADNISFLNKNASDLLK